VIYHQREETAMEEDELGTQREIGHAEYVVCSRCGKLARRGDMALVPADALEESSEYQYLCADCQSALADGEQDLPLTLP
jgi:hypothetical protein